jgi:hypothetical protein
MIGNLFTDEVANINSWYMRDVCESFDDSNFDATSVHLCWDVWKENNSGICLGCRSGQ